QAPARPVLIQLVSGLRYVQIASPKPIARWSGAEREQAGKVTMKMILQNNHGIMRVRMLLPTVRQQYHRSKKRRPSPEFAEQIALNADVFDPLVVDDLVLVVRATPASHLVSDAGIL